MSKALAKYNKDDIWALLSEVTDPEIPVLTIVELGIARNVELVGDKFIIKITPTYSGCPAMQAIEDEIHKKLRLNGIQNYEIRKDFSEPWTTDWMPDEAKKKLKKYGIAPPLKAESGKDFLNKLDEKSKKVPCPYCDSLNTELQSEFGSTACKAQYYCNDCDEPFEYFKCI
ncbi:MAG: phenylacetate-CoA oxygenase subunit PaaJ [Balneolaceae bacterium]|jgi:ring-1,2-phenylacetyl-CoA epoxidase subunit PaaD